MHLWHRVWPTLTAYCTLHSYVFIKDVAALWDAVSQQGHHFTTCKLPFIPETRNIGWNADVHHGHGEEVHRQLIQRRRKQKKEKKCSVKVNSYCHRNDCAYGNETWNYSKSLKHIAHLQKRKELLRIRKWYTRSHII